MRSPGKIPSILTVVAMIFAWLAISNHCAIVAVAAAATRAPSANECPFHSKKSAPSQPKPASNSTCCKDLRAIALKFTSNAAANFFFLCRLDFSGRSLTPAPQITTSPLLLDTGPPRAKSFAELILQRSILAHAPPLLA